MTRSSRTSSPRPPRAACGSSPGRSPGASARTRTLDDIMRDGDRSDLSPPARKGKAILLTSGTTGTPEGREPVPAPLARPRRHPALPHPAARAGEDHDRRAAVPHLGLRALHARDEPLLDRRAAAPFDPEGILSLTARHECAALVVVPVMLQRILQLDDEVLGRYDLSKLRVVPVSGSALAPALARRWMDLFGENLYNLYGSTEVAWATIATPEDLRLAPGTAGKAPRGTIVRIYDDAGSARADGRDGADLRRQRDAVRGLHGRRRQGHDRRADELGRRRPSRPGGPPVHRRPRRRHDHLGRGERVSRRGGGLPRRAIPRSPR